MLMEVAKEAKAKPEAAALDSQSIAARDEAADAGVVQDEAAVRHFVERVALLFADWGFPRMAARVLFALMTAPEPALTAPELAARLEVSPAAISGAVRYLGQIGFVLREGVPGSRRDRYRLREHTWYAGTATAVQFYDLLISAAEDALPPLGGAGTTAGERVAEMRDFFAFMRDAVPELLTRWEDSRKSRPGPGSTLGSGLGPEPGPGSPSPSGS